MAVVDDGDLVERFVRVALKGNLQLPEVQQFLWLEPEVPGFAQLLSEFYAAIDTFVSNVNSSRAPEPELELEPTDVVEAEAEPEVEVGRIVRRCICLRRAEHWESVRCQAITATSKDNSRGTAGTRDNGSAWGTRKIRTLLVTM
jgi:hypothetical protein